MPLYLHKLFAPESSMVVSIRGQCGGIKALKHGMVIFFRMVCSLLYFIVMPFFLEME